MGDLENGLEESHQKNSSSTATETQGGMKYIHNLQCPQNKETPQKGAQYHNAQASLYTGWDVQEHTEELVDHLWNFCSIGLQEFQKDGQKAPVIQ